MSRNLYIALFTLTLSLQVGFSSEHPSIHYEHILYVGKLQKTTPINIISMQSTIKNATFFKEFVDSFGELSRSHWFGDDANMVQQLLVATLLRISFLLDRRIYSFHRFSFFFLHQLFGFLRHNFFLFV